MSLTSWNTTALWVACASFLNNILVTFSDETFLSAYSLISGMNPRQAPEKVGSAHTLEDAANSKNTLQGYAAINDVDEHSEIAEEAASENPEERKDINVLAYQYYLERGGQHGSDEEDWYRAEREVRNRRSKER